MRIHSQEVRERARPITESIDLEGCEIVFVSEHIRNLAKQMFAWGDEKMVTIPNFVDVDRFERRNLTILVRK